MLAVIEEIVVCALAISPYLDIQVELPGPFRNLSHTQAKL